MRRRLVLTSATVCAVALVVAAWATGGLRAAPRPQVRAAANSVDLGRYAVRVTDAVLRRESYGGVVLIVTLRVTDKDDRSVPVQDLAVHALALDASRGTHVIPMDATGQSQGIDVGLLNPGVPTAVVLTYGLGRGRVPADFRARLALWAYDHRQDFFYGHERWISHKPTDAKDSAPSDFVVPLPIRREGV